jgi:hypothetical protein
VILLGYDWIDSRDIDKVKVPTYTRRKNVPEGLFSKSMCEQLKAKVKDTEKPAAYVLIRAQRNTGYMPLYDRKNHICMTLPVYKKRYEIGKGMVEEEYPDYYFLYRQCRDFNCVPKRSENPVAYIGHVNDNGIVEQYEPLYNRKEYVENIQIYENKKELPLFHITKEEAEVERLTIGKREIPACALKTKDGLVAYFERIKQLRVRKLVRGEYIPVK